jgi:hypothetical protein
VLLGVLVGVSLALLLLVLVALQTWQAGGPEGREHDAAAHHCGFELL